MKTLSHLYEENYTAWAHQNAVLLKTGQFSKLDIQHLLEELEEMGRAERNELENRLIILLAHLLKWQFQYAQLSERWQEFKGDSWKATIIEQRLRLNRRLRKSPGLKSRLPDVITEAYQDAVELASDETGLPTATFPEQCPYTQEQILNKVFFPHTE
ncbi:DUF29 domain-containing protein [Candidatus Venteria ishoeyi]|uniref:DUF29 domain-containing protein n=1 Tax=Candidatus Venteria ishoeyi TaxID=1899563 RepID=A0A1H6FDM1_9GAMM|nr:DUF29 domain-containing protein [Candidatus Venteria ishoeyi]MDM8546264.1 DUF29 domain-containing protein [Candidatus Venteria ishoeyi]SEH07419.1 Uncharacterised protein [Candidatus Venteria ishoeyi]